MAKPVPRKRFGQHFLHDKAVTARIIDTIITSPGEHIIEIGPGLGALTIPLMEQLHELMVVELDRDLVQRLQKQFADRTGLKIYSEDVLKFDFLKLGLSQLKVVGNLPYNISTPLLFSLFEQLECIACMVFMLQKEVVDRLCAEPGQSDYGRLSIMAQLYCETDKLFDVTPDAFDPPPKVMSSVVRLIPRENEYTSLDRELFSRVVKQAFSQRRKMLRNTLGSLITEEELTGLGLSSKSRAQELSISDYISITNFIKNKENS